MAFTQTAYLIVLLPLLASLLALALRNQPKRWVSNLTITVMGLAFLHALSVLVEVLQGASYNYSLTWLTLGNVAVNLGFMVDELTALMLVIVTFVSLMVQIYSQGYMEHDERYTTYYAFLTFFSSSMLGLVLSNNILGMFIFWELVGVSSYLLIGFWYHKPSAANACKKAFITTKVGDMGFFVGLMAIFLLVGSFEFVAIFDKVPYLSETTLTVIALLLFCGAVGKSAQFPLHIWLPNAMEGPTPVSALIHAATMVVAGIFLVARMYPLFSAAPFAMEVVAFVGAFTALFAATIAIVQNDIKAVLAYSTISQLGYMIAGLGVGAYTAGLYHMTTHAFFKALLFLGAGSVIHAVGTQDMREMGGLHKKMHTTFLTFLIGSLCLMGIPPFSGFFSKDEILLGAVHHPLIFGMLLTGAFITAFYVTRQVCMVFAGHPRDEHKFEHAHESPASMKIPLEILAVFAVLVGFLGLPGHALFGEFIHFGDVEHHVSLGVMLLSVLVAGAGVLLGLCFYFWKVFSAEKVASALRPLYVLLDRKYFIDELYEFVLIKGNKLLARMLAWFDRVIIDGIVNLVAKGNYLLGHAARLFDTYVIDAFVDLLGHAVKQLGWLFKFSQTGYVQNYLVVVIVGVIVLVVTGIVGVMFL